MGRIKSWLKVNKPKLTDASKYVISFLAGILIFRFVFLLGYIPSESMEPTLKTKSFCLGLREPLCGDIEKGDIVIFMFNGEHLVKRVAAVGGETIVADNGKEYAVPENCYFMLGDNTANSSDSRYWDNPYISQDQIVAKLVLPVR